jgi:uncharacterized protein (DUF305 family)
MRQFLTATGLVLTLIQAVPAFAEGEADQADMAGHDMTAMAPAGSSDGAANAAFADANARMHGAMNVPLTGNPDVDFIAGMIPHHQGAVDMARIVLEYGSDPEVRTFAEGVIAAQEAEIAWMNEWLKSQSQ